VVKLGRGVSVIGVSRPRPIGIRASPPGSGVVPFSSRKPPDANIRAPAKSSGRFASFAWTLAWIQAPTSPGPWERTIENNHAYGISCLTRPISVASTRADEVETGPAWAVSRDAPKQIERPQTEDDGLGQKSGLILRRSIAALNCFKTAR